MARKRIGPLSLFRCRQHGHGWTYFGTDPFDQTRITRHCRACGTYQDWSGERWTNKRGHDYPRLGTLVRPPLPPLPLETPA